MLLIGNKTDLYDKRQVSYDDASRFARNERMVFFEVSAKTGYSTHKIMDRIAQHAENLIDAHFQARRMSVIRLGEDNEDERGGLISSCFGGGVSLIQNGVSAVSGLIGY
jgi:ribosome biogenesis GTPase A